MRTVLCAGSQSLERDDGFDVLGGVANRDVDRRTTKSGHGSIIESVKKPVCDAGTDVAHRPKPN
jgi:hypothetical protein